MFLYIRKSLCHAARYDKPFLPRKGQAIPADMDMGKTTRTCMQCRGSRRAFTTIEERNGLMPGNMIGQPYLETALPAKFLQYDIASTVAWYRKYMTVLDSHLDFSMMRLGTSSRRMLDSVFVLRRRVISSSYAGNTRSC